jgi:Methyltransferase FkbM domain
VRPRRLPFGLAKGVIANIDFTVDSSFYFGRHEPELQPHYRSLLRRGMKCFDIGMYRGWDALTFAHITQGKVMSFDLNPQMVASAKKFIAPANLSIQLVHARLGDGSKGDLTIDEIASAHYLPDFIKIDVEGAEVDVLRGAKNTLATRRPSLVVEVHSKALENACIELLHFREYKPITVDPSRFFFAEYRSLDHNRWLIAVGAGS